jgi:hypothetical protein
MKPIIVNAPSVITPRSAPAAAKTPLPVLGSVVVEGVPPFVVEVTTEPLGDT